MIEAQSLNISSADVNKKKIYTLDGVDFEIFVGKNTIDDSFYLEIRDNDTKDLVWSNKITYLQEIIDCTLAAFPTAQIIPLNIDNLITGEGTRVIDDDTFGNEIKLFNSIEQL